jgi:hypothetical protein
MAKQEVEKVAKGTVEPKYAPPGVSFQDLANEATTLPGYELARDEDLDALCGVDFIITRVNFREGLARRENNAWLTKYPDHTKGAYVSLELTTNPEQSLTKVNRARSASGLTPIHDFSALGFDPGDHFVINDGSTGIYRQVVASLAIDGYIILPEGEMEGGSGQTIFDTIPEEWADVQLGDSRFDPTGFQTYAANVRIRCKHGVRISEYESDFNPDSKTRYLA